MAIDGVTVKPLDWHRVTHGWLAFSEIYRIEDNGANWPTERFWSYERGVRLGQFDTLEEAKSVVQVLHEARILSALAYEAAKPVADGADLRAAIEAEILPMTYAGADLTECVERVIACFATVAPMGTSGEMVEIIQRFSLKAANDKLTLNADGSLDDGDSNWGFDPADLARELLPAQRSLVSPDGG